MPAPRFAPRRNPDNPSYGPRIAKAHKILTGKWPLPWQQFVYDLAGEVDPKTGVRIYREVLLSAPRQQGKTTIIRGLKVHRALDCRPDDPQTILFAAQDGIEAKQKWLEHSELALQSPFRKLIVPGSPITSNGKEELRWRTGSTERPISSRPSSGHGVTLDLGLVTEAFSQVDYRYEETMLYAMRARPDAQFLAESTAGTAQSIYWNERLAAERARMTAEPDRPSRVALIDWSADPEADDPDAESTWAKVTPALGHTITLDQLRLEHETANTPAKLRAFRRGALNITDSGPAAGSIFGDDDWDENCVPGSRIAGAITFSLDVASDRSWSSIGISGDSIEAGRTHIGLARHERGTHWVIEYLVRKTKELGADRVYIGAGSQAALMREDLERAGLVVIIFTKAEVAAACAGLSDAVAAHSLAYTPGQTDLDAAVHGAVWTGGDQRVFSRGASLAVISPLYAVTLARHGHILAEANDYDVLDSIA